MFYFYAGEDQSKLLFSKSCGEYFQNSSVGWDVAKKKNQLLLQLLCNSSDMQFIRTHGYVRKRKLKKRCVQNSIGSLLVLVLFLSPRKFVPQFSHSNDNQSMTDSDEPILAGKSSLVELPENSKKKRYARPEGQSKSFLFCRKLIRNFAFSDDDENMTDADEPKSPENSSFVDLMCILTRKFLLNCGQEIMEI